MTSKEDLQTLLEYFYYQGKSPIIVKEQANFILNKIEKDLEVLEIFKKYYKSDGWSNEAVIQFWRMSEAQLNKIKEWLENE